MQCITLNHYQIIIILSVYFLSITLYFQLSGITCRSAMMSPHIVIQRGLLLLLVLVHSVSAVCTPFVYSSMTGTPCGNGLATSVNPLCKTLDLNINIGFCEVVDVDDLVKLETKMRVLGSNNVRLWNITTTTKQASSPNISLEKC